ncbi:anti-sigma factor [Anaeromyxobacter sp. Fw109-5]|uniref:anti-sigma factor family protein n=1 Tax=Anaeromyxobacter sp. (strain Fw109-5) TaxID=404589 RepID=UPI0000ED6FBD|nr:zf-HC2 domain-containing protein [Anaeromyxobacter sp. Fw109-5]ABS27802.1 putative transmembrane anti-sigma factor [Anaeromyxobacter sp. Fw109-5]
MTTAPVPDLSCRELVELVTDYLEGSLPADERTRFELHLTYCAWCRTYLAQMRQILERAGELTEASLAPEARDALLATFRDWKKDPGESA